MARSSAWKRAGRPDPRYAPHFERFGFDVVDEPIGGSGSIHLYIATKR